MDLSKLPKMSQTPPPPPPEAPEPEPPRSAPGPAAGIGGADAWISIAIGAIFLFMFPRFLQWFFSRTFGTHFDEFVDTNNVVVPYQTLSVFWSDLGPTTFALILIIDGLVLGFIRKAPMVLVALSLTLAAALFNLIWLVVSYSTQGFAIVSALAVAFGGYIASYQWQLYKTLQAGSR